MKSKRFMDIHELAEYLGVEVWTLYKWTSLKKIPFIKIGRLVRFDAKSINRWIEKNTIRVQKGKFPKRIFYHGERIEL